MHLADDRVAREGFAHQRLEVQARVVLHALDDPFIAQQLQVRDRDGRRDRMARVREAVVEFAVVDDRPRDAFVNADGPIGT